MPLDIVIGDPLQTKASFSRFILPIAYSLSPRVTPLRADEPHFRPCTPGDWISQSYRYADNWGSRLLRERWQYFATGVSELLYERARWLVLQDDFTFGDSRCVAAIPSRVGKSGGGYTIQLRPPALILFEFDAAHRHGRSRESCMQTGFLVWEVFFPKTAGNRPTFEDLLHVNDLFRHVRSPFPSYDRRHRGELRSIDLYLDGLTRGRTGRADTSNYGNTHSRLWFDPLSLGIRTPEGLFTIVPEDQSTLDMPILPDSRTYVSTCAVCLEPERRRDIVAGYRSAIPALSNPPYAGYWQMLLNVDKTDEPLGWASGDKFDYAWTHQRTYTRWIRYGIVYGYSDHSAAMMAVEREPPAPGVGDPPICLHFGQHYFDAILLCLYDRASLMRFHLKLQSITMDTRRDPASIEEWEKDFGDLRWDFTVFENLFLYPLISTQQQAIEMYAFMRRSLDIDDLYKEVERKIRSSDELVDNRLEQKRANASEKLNRLAGLGVVGGLLLAGAQVFFGGESALGTWGGAQVFALFATATSLAIGMAILLKPRFSGRKGK